jgi:hypothetical protein
MENINELLNFGYNLENLDDRIFRVKNSYGDTVATIFVKSGFIEIPKGKIFNYKNEVREGIKAAGIDKFFNIQTQ